MATEYWLIADTHFGHANIIKYCKRPFANVQEQDEVMVENWNRLVQPGDVVYHHGDFGFFRSTADAVAAVKRLNGQIFLIKGNHDSSKLVKKMPFADVMMMKEWAIPPNKVKMITMCHYPMDCWRNSHRGEWHTHGHTHAQLSRGHRLRIDVGVDARHGKKDDTRQGGFRPLNLEEVVKEFRRLEKKGWKSEIEKNDWTAWEGKTGPEDDHLVPE